MRKSLCFQICLDFRTYLGGVFLESGVVSVVLCLWQEASTIILISRVDESLRFSPLHIIPPLFHLYMRSGVGSALRTPAWCRPRPCVHARDGGNTLLVNTTCCARSFARAHARGHARRMRVRDMRGHFIYGLEC